MKASDIEASLNPIRMKILIILSQYGQMSTSQIKENITDVPQATLYRHINALVKADLIKIVQENKIRGAVEKIYSVNMDMNTVDPTDDEIIDLGYKFIISMLGELANYAKNSDKDVKKDMLVFSAAPLHLSDEEFMSLMQEVGPIYQKYLGNKPEEGKKLRTIYTVVVPNK